MDGIVVDKNSQQPLEGVTVRLLNKLNGKMDSKVAEQALTGHSSLSLIRKSDYTVVGMKEDYYTNSTDTTTKGLTRINRHAHCFENRTGVHPVPEKPIVLGNIYYDLDKWYIRPDAEPSLNKLVTIMKDNPGIKIELSSHTDSRAGDQYNLILSQKRAESAVEVISSTWH